MLRENPLVSFVWVLGCVSCTDPPRAVGAATAKETGGGRETGGTMSAWAQGDDIPGWEDADCSLPELGSGSVETAVHDPIEVSVGINPLDESGVPYALVLSVDIADCADGSCAGTDPHAGVSFTEFSAQVRVTKDAFRGRGLGWFGDAEQPRGDVQVASALLPNAFYTSDGSSGASVCLSRVRPDGLAGTLLLRELTGSAMESQWFDEVPALVAFEVDIGEHAATDYNLATDVGTPPDGADVASFWYGYYISYDTIWPWDLITDSDVRDAVYARYTPWNWP